MFDGLDMLNGVQEGRVFGKDPFLVIHRDRLKNPEIVFVADLPNYSSTSSQVQAQPNYLLAGNLFGEQCM